MEAATVTGPAKNLIRFARENRADAQQQPPDALARGLEIRIFTFVRNANLAAAGRTASTPFINAARDAGLTVEVISEKRRFDFSVLARLRSSFEEWQPAIVQTHSVKSHFLLSLLNNRRRDRHRPYRWIAFHHGYTNEDWKMRLYNTLDRYSLRHADRMVTVCEAFAPELASCGVPRERIEILHNSIDPAWATPLATSAALRETQALRASLGLRPDAFRILAIGRLSKEKGHAILIEAAAEVKRRRPDLSFELLLVGDGPLRAGLSALAKERGLEPQMRFAGQVGNVRPFFAVADVLALPSFSEGSPNVLLESMAARVPILATSVGGVPEIVEDRQTALLVPPGEPSAMAAALMELIDSPALRSDLADRASRRVEAEFTPARYDQRLRAIYEKTLAPAP